MAYAVPAQPDFASQIVSALASGGGWHPGSAPPAGVAAAYHPAPMAGGPSLSAQVSSAPPFQPPSSPQDQLQAYQRASALLQVLMRLYSDQGDPMFLRGYGRR